MTKSDETLHAFLEGLSGHADRPALIQVHDGRSELLSYDTLATEIACYAAGLREAGIGPGDYVALLAGGGPEWVTALLAVVGAGAVPVPLDAQLDERALRHILDDCNAACVITDTAGAEALDLAEYGGRRLHLDGQDDSSAAWRSLKRDNGNGFAQPRAHDTAVLFYTSGSTGPPKGVPLSHRNVAFQLASVTAAGLVHSGDRILQPLPPHHVYPLIVGTLAPLAIGLPVIFPESMLGPQIIAALREEHATFIVGVPRLYAALADGIKGRIAQQSGLAGIYLRLALSSSRWLRRHWGLRCGKILLGPLHRRLAPALRVLACGGAALDPELAWTLEGFGWQVAAGYGLTETSPLLTINPPGTRSLDTVGRPIPGIELRIDRSILAQDDGMPEDPREGEIQARGPGVFRGYHGLASQDVPFTTDGWFRTGDLGRIDDDGNLRISGRHNTMIVTSAGKNIQPDDLEEHYAEHPFIQEIGILLYEEQLVAVIVPAMQEIRTKQRSVQEALRDALIQQGRKVASYKRVSRHVAIGDLLPRTRLGKIRRHMLAALYEEQSKLTERERAGAAPQEIEVMSADDKSLLANQNAGRVWDLLAKRYPRHSLTLDTNFALDLGVDSLGWLDLSTDITQSARVRLAEERIVDIETVRDLLQIVSNEAQVDEIATPVENPDAFLSETQQRYLKPLGGVARLLARMLYGFNRILARLLFRLHIEGIDRLPPDRQLLFTPNHASFLDPFAVAGALPGSILLRTFWGGWVHYAFRNALFSAVCRLAHVVPIDPERAGQSSLAFAAAVMERGHNLVWFPEGERSETGELLDFKPGLGILLERFGDVTIVPTVIEGAHAAWPPESRWPRLQHISVRFGHPLTARQLIDASPQSDQRKGIVAGLRSTIESMLDESSPQGERIESSVGGRRDADPDA